MNGPLIVWLVSLGAVFLVGYAWGRSSRRPVIVNFPELPPITRLKPTAGEVAAAMRATDDGDDPMTARPEHPGQVATHCDPCRSERNGWGRGEESA